VVELGNWPDVGGWAVEPRHTPIDRSVRYLEGQLQVPTLCAEIDRRKIYRIQYCYSFKDGKITIFISSVASYLLTHAVVFYTQSLNPSQRSPLLCFGGMACNNLLIISQSWLQRLR
jgi:hypothetical protein